MPNRHLPYLIAPLTLLLGGCLANTPVHGDAPDQPSPPTQAAAAHSEAATGAGQGIQLALGPDPARPAAVPATPRLDLSVPPPPPAPRTIWGRLRARLEFSDRPQPAAIEHRIDTARRYWLANRTGLARLLRRTAEYLPVLLQRLERDDLPGELALLPAVESGFDPGAKAPSGAAGLWQFMPATAAEHGLQREWWYDGRLDPIASTSAALGYLRQLHGELGDWLLAIAAYNAGAGTVRHALREASAEGGHGPGYWQLQLPGETQAYVPRLLALASLIREPARYGLSLPQPQADRRLVSLDTGGPVELGLAAELAGMSEASLRALNPGHRRWAIGPDSPHHLLLPAAQAERLADALSGLDRDERVHWGEHRIRSGETLGGIARRYGISVAVLRQVNDLHGDLIRAGSRLLIPKGGDQGSAPVLVYQVRAGDNLWTIAHDHGVSVAQLKDWNGLSTDRLTPGQHLRLRASGASRQARIYQVRPGDSLWTIAHRHGVTVGDLRDWNDLKSDDLRPGQRLSLYPREG